MADWTRDWVKYQHGFWKRFGNEIYVQASFPVMPFPFTPGKTETKYLEKCEYPYLFKIQVKEWEES